MTDLQVLDIARVTAANLGIEFEERTVAQNMRSRGPITSIIKHGDITIWIDRHYISFCRDDDFNENYVYLSRSQIENELPDIIKRLKNVRSMNDYVLLSGIKRQMCRALIGMNASGDNDYIFMDNGEFCQLR